MNCPYCNHDSKVTNSRLQKRSNSVWRRRQCLSCHAIWTTSERLQGSGTFKVDVNGNLVDFHPELLLISLYESLKHRKTPAIDAQYIFSTVLEQLQKTNKPVFTTQLISQTVHKVLKNFDKLGAELYKTLHPFSD
jgi:transcriptional repressor NrdR